MLAKNIKWGFIGCGDVTEVKSGPAYQLVEGFSVEAVMRRNAEKLDDYAKRHQIKKTYLDAPLLINDPDIDAVYIATPPDSHLEYALKVAEAGKICCIEKPMAVNYKQSEAIFKAFEAKQLPLYVAYYRRNLDRFLKIQAYIQQGKLGKIHRLDWVYTRAASEQDLSRAYNWRTDKNVAPAGYFDDLACHGLDIFAFLFGAFGSVKGSCANKLGLYTSYDVISAKWTHENGIEGSGVWDFGATNYKDEVNIYGDKGALRFSIFGDTPIRLTQLTGKEAFLQITNPKHIQLPFVTAMAQNLGGEQVHISTGKTALHTAWVMSAILGD